MDTTLNTTARVLKIMLTVCIALGAGHLISGILDIMFLREWEALARGIITDHDIHEIERRSGGVELRNTIIGVSSIITSLALAIAFFIWIYRINKFIGDSGGGLKYSPGWAAGWFFIPVANLWKPYHVVKELYIKSGKADALIIAVWWAVWLISIAASNISIKMSLSALQSFHQMIQAAYVDQFANIADMLELALRLLIISRIFSGIKGEKKQSSPLIQY